MRTAIAAAIAILGLAFVAAFVDWWRLDQSIRQTSHEVRANFPVGMALTAASAVASAHYPRTTIYPAAECDALIKKDGDAERAAGGPCLFGVAAAGKNALGFRAEVSFALLFGPDAKLKAVRVRQINTWL